MTDGGVILDNRAIESKRFCIKDGLGVKLWRQSGGEFGIVTGRNSHVVQARAMELGVEIVRQGVGEKLSVVKEIAKAGGWGGGGNLLPRRRFAGRSVDLVGRFGGRRRRRRGRGAPHCRSR